MLITRPALLGVFGFALAIVGIYNLYGSNNSRDCSSIMSLRAGDVLKGEYCKKYTDQCQANNVVCLIPNRPCTKCQYNPIIGKCETGSTSDVCDTYSIPMPVRLCGVIQNGTCDAQLHCTNLSNSYESCGALTDECWNY
jgi:hypothetical protein